MRVKLNKNIFGAQEAEITIGKGLDISVYQLFKNGKSLGAWVGTIQDVLIKK
jgi:hypothetical protein